MKSYSHDIRQRIVKTYQNGEGSQREIAVRFDVSLSFVRGLLRRFRQTGSIDPKPHRGGPAPRLAGRGLEVVRELLQAEPQSTLAQLCERVAAEGRPRPSRATMSRVVRRLKDEHTARKASLQRGTSV